MSEKRFIEDFSYLINYPKHHCVFDGMQQKDLELDEIVALLNQLYDENRELRQELEENKSIINFCSNGDEDEDLHRLIKENEQLRKKNEEYKINWSNSMDIARLNQEATREFHRENEQLRRECKSYEHLCEYYRQKYKKLLEDVQENVKGELVIR